MKKVFYLIAILFNIAACKKDAILTPKVNSTVFKTTLKKFSNNETAEKYCLEHLTLHQDFIFYLIHKEKEIYFEIIEKAKEKFDDEFHVLLTEKFYRNLDTNIDIEEEYGRFASNNGTKITFDEFIHAFNNIEKSGENYFPQLYIPTLIENSEMCQSSSEITSIVLPKDTKQEVFNAKKYKAGVFEVNISNVDENYANNNNTWVFAINESVNFEGKYTQQQDVQKNQEVMPIVRVRMGKLSVRDHKESWAAGASEIAIHGGVTTYNCTIDGAGGAIQDATHNNNGFSYASPGHKGFEMKKINRIDVKNWTIFDINETITDSWTLNNFYSEKVKAVFVIFESDSWPTATNVSEVSPCLEWNTKAYFFSSRSEHTFYDKDFVFGLNTNPAIVGAHYADTWSYYEINSIYYTFDLY